MISEEKRINFLLLITAHALIVSGLTCVIITGEIPVPLWVLALAAHPLSIFMKPKEGRYFFNIIVILAFSYFLLMFFILQTPFLYAFTQFLIVVQAVKLFHLEKAKDYFQLAGLGLFTTLAATGLTSQIYYLFFLLLILLFGICFLFLLHLKRDMERHPALHPPRRLTSPSLFVGISGAALCSFIITIIIFFTLPRITLSVSGRERLGGATSGFSDVVDLGTVGPVRLDNRVVMRVELPQFDQQPPFPLYWRGTSFSRWDGQKWEKSDVETKIPQGTRGRVTFSRRAGDTEVIHQDIMIEPLDTDILFCLHPPIEIRGRFPHLLVDQGGGIHLPSPPLGRYHYEVTSSIQPLKTAEPGFTEKPNEVNLQLPENSKTIVALAQEIVAGTTMPQKKVHQVITYLQDNCTYSLNPKRDVRFSSLEDFVLHTREGYCEHFATAAALLLRGAGVPTRLVSGFLQGEWNPLGKYFMVRQRDAHTWIEVYLPDSGWTPFDPTPTAQAKAFPPLVSSLYRYYDFLKLKWNRYIIQYSRRDQLRLFLFFRQQFMGLRFFPQTPTFQGIKEKTAQVPAYLVAALAASACILLIAWGFKKKRSMGKNRAGTPPTGVSFYLKTLKILKRKKIPKRATETPAEFARRVGKKQKNITPLLKRITALYYRVRFGYIALTPHEEKEAKLIIREIQKCLSTLSPQ
jgi:protein-glutamine gamma-glutamyltransferase